MVPVDSNEQSRAHLNPIDLLINLIHFFLHTHDYNLDHKPASKIQ